MTTREQITLVMNELQKLVRDFPKETPPICHAAVQNFLEVVAAYQEWTNELQKMIVSLDADNQRMKKTVEFQGKKLFERKKEEAAEVSTPKLILPDSMK